MRPTGIEELPRNINSPFVTLMLKVNIIAIALIIVLLLILLLEPLQNGLVNVVIRLTVGG